MIKEDKLKITLDYGSGIVREYIVNDLIQEALNNGKHISIRTAHPRTCELLCVIELVDDGGFNDE